MEFSKLYGVCCRYAARILVLPLFQVGKLLEQAGNVETGGVRCNSGNRLHVSGTASNKCELLSCEIVAHFSGQLIR